MRLSDFIWSQRRVPGRGVRNSALRLSTPLTPSCLGYKLAYTRFVCVQSDDKGTRDQDAVPLDAPHRAGDIPVLLKVEFLAYFPEPLERGGFKADEDADATGFGS